MPSLACVLLCSAILTGSTGAEISWDAYIDVFKRCKDEVAAQWHYEPDLLCAAATVCGTQQKSVNVSEVRNIFTRDASIDPGRPEIAAGIPVFGGVQLYVSDRFKFVYIRQTRAASSSVLATIQELVCDAKVCLSHEFSERSADLISDEVWAEYFVFTVVRNPIVRMISAFTMLSSHLRHRDGKATASANRGCQSAVSFSEFADSVLKLRTACDTRQCCCYSPQGVDQFVADMPQPYITQQAHSVFTPDGRSLVDYIARAEDPYLLDDWDEIMWLISQRNGRNVPRRALMRLSASTSAGHLLRPDEVDVGSPRSGDPGSRCLDPRLARLGYLNATTALGLAKQFAMDMQLLGFSRP